LLLSLGAIGAIVTLAAPSSITVQRRSLFFAVAPGLAVALATAIFARRGISSQLCELVPHTPVDWPAAGPLSVVQVLSGQHFYIDWMCRNVIANYDQIVPGAARLVASIGAPALIISTVFGLALLAVTVLFIGHTSGVPFGRLWALLRERPVSLVVGVVVILPVFATSVDWCAGG
jgi:small basic protein